LIILQQPWCNTCGTPMDEDEYEHSGGECTICAKWWEENEYEDSGVSSNNTGE